MIHRILKNENYVGNIIYNRTSRRLGQKLVKNPRHQWVRGEAVIDPIVDKSLFARAQKIMEERYLSLPDDQMLLRLRLLLHRKRKLSFRTIESAPGVPSVASYVKRFGSLRKVYALVGYVSPRDCDWIDTRKFWAEVLTRHVTDVAESLRSDKGFRVDVDEKRCYVTVNGETRIFFLTARQAAKRRLNHLPYWRVYRRREMSGFLVVLRLDERNREIEDYLILPASRMRGAYIGFSNAMIYGATRVETLDELIVQIRGKFRKGSRSGTPKRSSARRRTR